MKNEDIEMSEIGRRLEDAWIRFTKETIDSEAPEIQKSEMRMAFFAGMYQLRQSILNIENDENEFENISRLMEGVFKKGNEYVGCKSVLDVYEKNKKDK